MKSSTLHIGVFTRLLSSPQAPKLGGGENTQTKEHFPTGRAFSFFPPLLQMCLPVERHSGTKARCGNQDTVGKRRRREREREKKMVKKRERGCGENYSLRCT